MKADCYKDHHTQIVFGSVLRNEHGAGSFTAGVNAALRWLDENIKYPGETKEEA